MKMYSSIIDFTEPKIFLHYKPPIEMEVWDILWSLTESRKLSQVFQLTVLLSSKKLRAGELIALNAWNGNKPVSECKLCPCVRLM